MSENSKIIKNKHNIYEHDNYMRQFSENLSEIVKIEERYQQKQKAYFNRIKLIEKNINSMTPVELKRKKEMYSEIKLLLDRTVENCEVSHNEFKAYVKTIPAEMLEVFKPIIEKLNKEWKKREDYLIENRRDMLINYSELFREKPKIKM